MSTPSISSDQEERVEEGVAAALPSEENVGASNNNSTNNLEEEGSIQQWPQTLQNFLSHFGVLAGGTGGDPLNEDSFYYNDDAHPEDHHHQQQQSDEGFHADSWESIFESSFDLTEDRLKYVFTMFDTDEDGRISYPSLRRGLELHTAGSAFAGTLLDEASFNELVKILDLDGSEDITFEEFSQGLRLLMLRALLHAPRQVEDTALIEVMDYDATRLERRIVKNGSEKEMSISDQVQQIEATDFYFQDRPDWVTTRWINVSGATSSLTMKRLAVKYMLHPLALEDALSPSIHRPKAEVYSNHYFIMIPVFVLDAPTFDKKMDSSRSRSLYSRLCCWAWSSRFRRRRRKQTDDNGREIEERPVQVGKIRVQMTSLFVNVPKNNTIITYNDHVVGTPMNETKSQRSSPLHFKDWLRVQQELGKSYSKLRQYDGQYLTYALLDQAVDLIGPIVVTMRHEIAREKEIARRTKFERLERIHQLREELEKVARKLKPFMRLLVHVIEDEAISPGATVYLRDVLDNLEGHDDDVKQLSVECQAIDVDGDKFRSHQMDQTLYTLTVISAVFLPAQFLTGVWGMNFVYMPELDEKWGYAMFWALSVFMMVALVVTLNFGRLR